MLDKTLESNDLMLSKDFWSERDTTMVPAIVVKSMIKTESNTEGNTVSVKSLGCPLMNYIYVYIYIYSIYNSLYNI